MKKVNGTFIGKMKISADSKYYDREGLNKDVEDTNKKINMFKHELETVIDMCYERHVGNFKQYETAIEILQETLRDKFVEYGERL